MRRAAVLFLLCAACRGKPDVPILNYHSVGEKADEYTVTEAQFAQQLDALPGTTSLHEMAKGKVVLTFDDGKEDALIRVLPALQKRNMHAAFFIITSLVGTPGYLTWDGVRALDQAGMEIGSHTATHPRLADLPDGKVLEELTASKEKLEAELHKPVDLLAYPYNSVRANVRDAAQTAGYGIAVSGVAHGGSDKLNLMRISVTGLTTFEQFKQAIR